MNNTILIQNPLICAPMTGECPPNGEIKTFRGGHILIENGRIESIGELPFSGVADVIINASRMVVLPGLVNTHH
ncbi:MAG: hypothetical protein WC611_09980, partial [Candidatus Neomarinimicrobiota bacterium]